MINKGITRGVLRRIRKMPKDKKWWPKEVSKNNAVYNALTKMVEKGIIAKDDSGYSRISDNPVRDYYRTGLKRGRPRKLAAVAKIKGDRKFGGIAHTMESVIRFKEKVSDGGGVIPWTEGNNLIAHEGRLFMGMELAVIPKSVLEAMTAMLKGQQEEPDEE